MKTLGTHMPAYIATALVIVNALEQAGTLRLSTNIVVIVNAVLAAFGLGLLHIRQQAIVNTLPATPVGK